jgi:hypothetical protein
LEGLVGHTSEKIEEEHSSKVMFGDATGVRDLHTLVISEREEELEHKVNNENYVHQFVKEEPTDFRTIEIEGCNRALGRKTLRSCPDVEVDERKPIEVDRRNIKCAE